MNKFKSSLAFPWLICTRCIRKLRTRDSEKDVGCARRGAHIALQHLPLWLSRNLGWLMGYMTAGQDCPETSCLCRPALGWLTGYGGWPALPKNLLPLPTRAGVIGACYQTCFILYFLHEYSESKLMFLCFGFQNAITKGKFRIVNS